MRIHADGHVSHYLIYDGPLPPLRGKIVHPMARYRLKQRARKVFGEFPPKLYATRKALVIITRVLGPGQREMDKENLANQVAGLVDSLKPSYIVDDRPKWATIDWVQDTTRRAIGPRIEVSVTYEEAPSCQQATHLTTKQTCGKQRTRETTNPTQKPGAWRATTPTAAMPVSNAGRPYAPCTTS